MKKKVLYDSQYDREVLHKQLEYQRQDLSVFAIGSKQRARDSPAAAFVHTELQCLKGSARTVCHPLAGRYCFLI
jgi:hypothetical protein